jgi:TolA-binding protein
MRVLALSSLRVLCLVMLASCAANASAAPSVSAVQCPDGTRWDGAHCVAPTVSPPEVLASIAAVLTHPSPQLAPSQAMSDPERTVATLRDPWGAGAHPPRPCSSLALESLLLEQLEKKTSPSAPDRPALMRRIAEDRAELARAALAEGREDVARPARADAIRRFEALLAAPSPEGAAASSKDDLRYELAFTYEKAGDATNAMRVYADLLRISPASVFAARAYFGLGEVLLSSGFDHARVVTRDLPSTRGDESRLTAARTAFHRAAGSDGAPSDFRAAALVRVGQVDEALGDTAAALRVYEHVCDDYGDSGMVDEIPAWAKSARGPRSRRLHPG